MKTIHAAAALAMVQLVSSPLFAAEPPLANAKAAFRMILEGADVNKDGKLSAAECQAMWKDKRMAQKNCSFWDVDKDGLITEAEYVRQASRLGRKR